MTNPEVLNIFPTPVIKFKFDKHDEYTWVDWDKHDRKPMGWQCSVNTSYPQVQDDDPYVSKDVVDSLKKDLLEAIKAVHLSYGLGLYIDFDDFWYNAYYVEQGQEAHHHLPSPGISAPIWSGVYFAKNCISQQFSFVKTDYSLRSQGLSNFMDSDLSSYYDEHHAPDISDGDVVLFPPHLHHRVGVHDKEYDVKQRLTFSFNLNNVDVLKRRR